MIPRVAKAGRSFKGAGAYYLHDKGHRSTDKRVLFTHTENLPTRDPEKALKCMAWTAMHAEQLKLKSGWKLTGRKGELPVYSYSLAWHPDQDPTKEQMIDAARESLKILGLDKHEALFVAHGDTRHPHIHVIVNRVNPETGVTKAVNNDYLKFSKWAQQYELSWGKILCEQRVENNRRREDGYYQKYDPHNRARALAAWRRHEANEAFKRRQAEMASQRQQQTAESRKLYHDKEDRVAEARKRVRDELRPEWKALYQKQKKELADLKRLQKLAADRLRLATRAPGRAGPEGAIHRLYAARNPQPVPGPFRAPKGRRPSDAEKRQARGKSGSAPSYPLAPGRRPPPQHGRQPPRDITGGKFANPREWLHAEKKDRSGHLRRGFEHLAKGSQPSGPGNKPARDLTGGKFPKPRDWLHADKKDRTGHLRRGFEHPARGSQPPGPEKKSPHDLTGGKFATPRDWLLADKKDRVNYLRGPFDRAAKDQQPSAPEKKPSRDLTGGKFENPRDWLHAEKKDRSGHLREPFERAARGPLPPERRKQPARDLTGGKFKSARDWFHAEKKDRSGHLRNAFELSARGYLTFRSGELRDAFKMTTTGKRPSQPQQQNNQSRSGGSSLLHADKEDRSGYLREVFLLSAKYAMELAERQKKERTNLSAKQKKRTAHEMRDIKTAYTADSTALDKRQNEEWRALKDRHLAAREQAKLDKKEGRDRPVFRDKLRGILNRQLEENKKDLDRPASPKPRSPSDRLKQAKEDAREAKTKRGKFREQAKDATGRTPEQDKPSLYEQYTKARDEAGHEHKPQTDKKFFKDTDKDASHDIGRERRREIKPPRKPDDNKPK
jgi:hypothetical protein